MNVYIKISRNLGGNFLDFWQFFKQLFGISVSIPAFIFFSTTVGKVLIRNGLKWNELTTLGCYRGLKRWVRCGMSPHVRMNPRRSKTVLNLDSMLWNFELQVVVVIWIPDFWAEFRFSKPRIPHSKSKSFRISESAPYYLISGEAWYKFGIIIRV